MMSNTTNDPEPVLPADMDPDAPDGDPEAEQAAGQHRNKKDTLRSRVELVRTCVRDEAEYIRENKYPEDSLHELADGCVPVYYGDLADVLASDTSLGFGPEELEADPDGGVWKMLQVAIYERLYDAAMQEADELGLLD